jgi:hypothetical protein
MLQTSNYSLHVISQHPDFFDKTLAKHQIDGVETIGVYGQESFYLQFTNHTQLKIQVRFSIDGIDLLTEEAASTKPQGDMWIVRGFEILTIKACPGNECNSFVFTNLNNNVSVNVKGVSQGIIAAAVFVEENSNPFYTAPYHYFPNVPISIPSIFPDNSNIGYDTTYTYCSTYNQTTTNTTTNQYIPTYTTGSIPTYTGSLGTWTYNDTGVSLFGHSSGLNKPKLSQTLKIRYLWWDDLKEKLQAINSATSHIPSGFPLDSSQETIATHKIVRILDINVPPTSNSSTHMRYSWVY